MEAVRRAELVQEATTRPVVGTGRTTRGGNRLSARLCLDLVESLGNLFDCLVVRDLLPLVLALFASALERMVDAGGMVDVQKRARTAAAQTTLVVVIGIAFDLDYVAVLDIGKDTAVGMAEIALRSDALDAFGEFAVLVVNADLISHLPSPLLLVLQTPTIRFVGFCDLRIVRKRIVRPDALTAVVYGRALLQASPRQSEFPRRINLSV